MQPSHTSFSHPEQLTRGFRLLVTLILLGSILVLAAVSVRPTTSVGAAPAYSGWTQVWADDFSGAANTGINTANWLYDLGTSYPGGAPNWGTGEQETMTNSTANVYQTGSGQLAIKPIRGADGRWTSGRIETQRTDFQPPAGGVLRVEASLQLPNVTGAAAAGYWPAFWMLGAPFRGNYQNWPMVGEIDIMENVNGVNNLWGTLHCGTSPGGICNETTGIGNNTTNVGITLSPSMQAAYHTYTIEWDKSISPNQIRWYVDNRLYHTVNATQVDATTWTNATNHGYFIILNVAMDGGWPGPPSASTTSGAPMLVDYVAVYSKAGGTPPPTTPPGPTTPPAPTQTPASSGNFTQGVTNLNSTQAQIWFRPTTASTLVDVHYSVNGAAQQNFRMTNNAGTWQQTVSSLTSGAVIDYWFTYEKSGPLYDTGHYAYTHNGTAPTSPPAATATRTNTTGSVAPTATRTRTNTTGSVAPTATRTRTNTTASGTTAWAAGVYYAIGATVSYGGYNYRCIQAHTSQTGWEPPSVASLWTRI